MDYKEFLEYIYERHSGNVKLGLDRMLSILDTMGNPERKLSGIHVGGTNGKGSTCAMLESLGLEFELITGMNTSPHLIDYRERIRIEGKNISSEELLRSYGKWKSVFEKYEASFFEITTAMAFYYFLQKQVELAIFEVGLGGRLDGTNPFAAEVSVISSISFDHIKSLGNSLEKIAWEKAGIIKPGQDVVIGRIPEKAFEVIRGVAERCKARLMLSGKDFEVNNIRLDEYGTVFDYRKSAVTYKDLRVNLVGEHQAYNAGLAVTSFSIWLEKQGKILSEYKLRQALQQVNWNGRMQILRRSPVVIIDGAHNMEGISRLTSNLEKIFRKRRIIAIIAILRDKNLEEMIKEIIRISEHIYISKNKSKRAAEIADQLAVAEKYKASYETAPDVVTACTRAIKAADKEDVVVVAGSLYTISEILASKILKEVK